MGNIHPTIHYADGDEVYIFSPLDDFELINKNGEFTVKKISDGSIVFQIQQDGVTYLISDGIMTSRLNMNPIAYEIPDLLRYIGSGNTPVYAELCKTMEFIFSTLCT